MGVVGDAPLCSSGRVGELCNKRVDGYQKVATFGCDAGVMLTDALCGIAFVITAVFPLLVLNAIDEVPSALIFESS